MRTNFDFTPYRRSSVGFDRLFDLLETGTRDATDGYPPFDIAKDGEDSYRITLAAAGFMTGRFRGSVPPRARPCSRCPRR